ncbi:flippase [Natrialbaceae archaeon GCM10025810]|uniref:flippase n=1 Tax=Halovalidus salilacus TaxID=3075124 RepID=UPI003609ABFD
MSATTDDLSKLLSSASLVFAASLVGSFSTLIERVVISRLLSPQGYGEVSVAIAVFSLAATVGAAGFTQGVPRYMARFDDERDERGAWLTGLVLTVALSSAIAVALVAASPIVVPRLFDTDEAMALFLIFAVSVPLFVSFRIAASAIRGQENTLYKVLTRDIGYRFARILLIAAFLWVGVGIVGAALGYLVALVVALVVAYVLLNRLLPLRGEYELHVTEMTVFSLPLVVSTVMSNLLTRTDTVMLGYFRASSEVGIYNAAYPLATSLTVVLGAFGYLYLPMASRIDSEDEGSVERVYEITTKWIFLLAFPLFLTVVAFSDQIVSLFFGDEYVAGGAALAVLSVGFFTNAAVGRNRETLSALGATQLILVSNVVAFALNFVLNVVLIPPFGFMGAAAASASSYVALNVVVYAFLRYRFDITPFTRSSVRLYVGLPLLIGVPCLLVGRHVGGGLPVIAVFGVAVTVLTIVSVVLAGGLEPEDAVLVEFVERKTGRRVPLIRRYIPG